MSFETARPVTSLEYLAIEVAGSVTINSQPVHLAFVACATDEPEWIEAAWEGPIGTTRTVRTLVGPGGDVELTRGVYTVWIKVTDTVEIPAFPVGRLRIY